MNCVEPDESNPGQEENGDNNHRMPIVFEQEGIDSREKCQTPKFKQNIDDCDLEPPRGPNVTYLEPEFGAEFESEDHAYECYSRFAVLEGFSIRKDFVNKSRVNGAIVSRRFTCYRQGHGSNNKTRPETRTGCLSHMTVARQPNGKFRAIHFENDHNHGLVTPSSAHLLPSQKRLTFSQAVEAHENGLIVGPDGVPKLGTGFGSEDEAYEFYNAYAGRVGFGVRKDYVNRSKVDGVVVSRRFTCFREGFRQRDRRDVTVRVKRPRKETRIGCTAQLVISRQPDGKYRVTNFEESHNHELLAPCRVHTLRSQKKSESVCDDNKIGHDWVDYKRKLPFKCSNNMSEEEAVKLRVYFRSKHFKNLLFFYSIQPDVDDRMTNVFWAEAKMVVDYGDFGDVVCFDSTQRSGKYSRPFVLFVGVNHHKQMVIFGAALLYDETVESYKWLFQTFLEAMSGKKPKTILIDQNVVMSEAIDSVFEGTNRRFCVWQLYCNTLKRLDHMFVGGSIGSSSFSNDISRCFFDHEEEEDFNISWKSMLDLYGLWENEWLNSIYEDREKWAVPYGKHLFCADVRSTLRNESFGTNFRKYLNPGSDAILLLKHVSKVVNDLHYKELDANYEMTQNPPKIMGDVILLIKARDIYTPRIFELLQNEYESCLDIVVNQWTCSGTLFEFSVSVYGQPKVYKVSFDSTDETVFCECMKFEFVGVLCSHALKVLDYRNLRLIPNKYILKRWTRNARV